MSTFWMDEMYTKMKAAKIWMMISVFCKYCACKEVPFEVKLHRDLFQNYSADVRPVTNLSSTTKANISLYVLQIGQLNARDQTLSSSTWMDVTWIDELLTWKPEEYGNVTRLTVKHDKIWIPDLLIRNEKGNNKGLQDDRVQSYSKPMIFHDGTVLLWPGKEITTHCRIDVSKYPFDTQHCVIQIGKWTSDDSIMDIFPMKDHIDLSYYEKSEEWELTGTSVEKKTLFEDNDYYSSIFYAVNLKRRPLFSILNIVMPIFFLSLLNHLSFVLPIESGEKIGLCMAIFLTFAVFLSLISQSLPRSSLHVPAFGVYLLAQNLLSGLTITSQVFVLYFYHKMSAISQNGRYYSNDMKSEVTEYNGDINECVNLDSSVKSYKKVDYKTLSRKVNFISGLCILALNASFTAFFFIYILD